MFRERGVSNQENDITYYLNGIPISKSNYCARCFASLIMCVPLIVILFVNFRISRNADGFNIFLLFPLITLGIITLSLVASCICGTNNKETNHLTASPTEQTTTYSLGAAQEVIPEENVNYTTELISEPVAIAVRSTSNDATLAVAYPIDDYSTGNSVDLDPMVKRF